MLRPTNGGSTRGQGGARGRRDPRRRARHRRRPRRGGRDRLRDRAQHARAALRVRPARDDRGDRRARHRRGRRRASRSRSTTSIRDEVRALVERIDAEQGRLDVLVNDIWGAEHLLRVGHAGLGARPRRRAAAAAARDRHPPHHEPPRAAAADRAARRARGRGDRRHRRRTTPTHYRISVFYDLAKTSVIRLAWAQGAGAARRTAPPRWRSRPGWLRSEMMLEAFGVTEDELARRRSTRAAALLHLGDRRASSAAPSRRSPPIPTSRAGTGSRCRAAQLAQVYGFTDLDGTQPDAWRYIVEVQRGGAARRTTPATAEHVTGNDVPLDLTSL